jgi:hypothetical protein
MTTATMKKTVLLLLAQANLAAGDAHLASIAGYAPGSDVTQHNALDLDQKELEEHLKADGGPDFVAAGKIYNLGANSGGYAQMTLPALAADVAKKAEVTQADNANAAGKVKSAAAGGDTTLKVSYGSTCKEGGAATPDVTGCFTTAGAVTAGGADLGTPTALTNKYRNLAGFSTAAGAKMKGQAHYEKYKAYYKAEDYGHQFVTSALEGTGDFAGQEDVARVEGTKKGSVYLNVWMYVIREFEDAIADCKAGCIDCNDDPVHAWDEGVAFYTGTLEGTDGSGSGKMLYALAEKRCKNYATCGSAEKVEDRVSGNAQVNIELFKLFNKGRDLLQAGTCAEVRPLLDQIVPLMTVPQLQGPMRYAYKVAELGQNGPKERAEGAVFAAAILPQLHACDAEVAKLIEKNMKMNAGSPMGDGWEKVYKALQSTYPCLGISCAHVGGLYLGADTVYYPKFDPCVDKPAEDAGVSVGSCYDDPFYGAPHTVACNVPEDKCDGMKWYPPGMVSERSGCCHCKASCPAEAVTAECEDKYYADGKPKPDDYKPDEDGDHEGDDHDGDHEGHDHAGPAPGPAPSPGPDTVDDAASQAPNRGPAVGGLFGLLLGMLVVAARMQ